HGRELADAGSFTESDPLRPQNEAYLLLGDRLHLQTPPRGGFSMVGDQRGSRHAAPLECTSADFGNQESPRLPLRLDVRHYFAADPDSGLVRVTASRLVSIRKDSA